VLNKLHLLHTKHSHSDTPSRVLNKLHLLRILWQVGGRHCINDIKRATSGNRHFTSDIWL